MMEHVNIIQVVNVSQIVFFFLELVKTLVPVTLVENVNTTLQQQAEYAGVRSQQMLNAQAVQVVVLMCAQVLILLIAAVYIQLLIIMTRMETDLQAMDIYIIVITPEVTINHIRKEIVKIMIHPFTPALVNYAMGLTTIVMIQLGMRNYVKRPLKLTVAKQRL